MSSPSPLRRLSVPTSGVAWLAVPCLIALPFVGISEYAIGIFTLGLFFAVYAMGWDLLFGYAGEPNFGATFLIGVGAYSAAMLNSNGIAPPWICILAGAAMSVAAGVLLALPALRLRGPYFGLVTLVAVLILRQLIILFSHQTGGEIGIAVPEVLALSPIANYEIALGCAIVSAGVFIIVARSPFGLILQAIGQDPLNAQAMGFSSVKYKLAAFCYSALFSGLAGALMTFYMGTASLNIFVDAAVGVQIIIAAIIGGRRTIIGPAIGGVFLIVLGEYMRPFGRLSELVVAVVALLVLLFLPNGLLGLVKLKRRAH
ncbi:branched-chain amino acid ABC transporter permease [Bradyrhizobium sp. CCBAU 51627]|uniref:branched-chain amino acid ABC transporter permease n=1 Tax=Bradyrhizobium sp. CCBAU 51627 TaxID=1325088 RepID=UPI002305A2FF|nr:branched-chain amino acid ABC transporter permease [Bradyrhizobium sp. CCBAU 51627]